MAEGTQHDVTQSAGPLVQAFECSRIGTGWLLPLGFGGFYFAVGSAGNALSWSMWLVVGFFVLVAFVIWRRMPSEVAVHTGGLVIARGRRTQFVPWSEIEEVVADAYSRRSSALGARSYSVLFKNGPPLPLRHQDGENILECMKRTRPEGGSKPRS